MQKQTPQDLLLLAERSLSYVKIVQVRAKGNEKPEVFQYPFAERSLFRFRKYCIRIHAFGIYAFALAGRICGGQQTQGDALGYALAGPSARSLNAC